MNPIIRRLAASAQDSGSYSKHCFPECNPLVGPPITPPGAHTGPDMVRCYYFHLRLSVTPHSGRSSCEGCDIWGLLQLLSLRSCLFLDSETWTEVYWVSLLLLWIRQGYPEKENWKDIYIYSVIFLLNIFLLPILAMPRLMGETVSVNEGCTRSVEVTSSNTHH